MNFAKVIYKKPAIISVVAFLLAGLVFYYLINSGIGIVNILAVSAFMALMLVIELAGNVKELIRKYENEAKEGKLWKRYWFYTSLGGNSCVGNFSNLQHNLIYFSYFYFLKHLYTGFYLIKDKGGIK